MPSLSFGQRLKRERAQVSTSARLLDFGLSISAPDDSVTIHGGGMWDPGLRQYVRESENPHRVRLVSSQIRAGHQLAKWFTAYDAGDEKRIGLAVFADRRRGGKTWFIVAAPIALCLKYPVTHLGRTIAVIVVPTYPQQREIHETVRGIIPRDWFRDGRIRYHKAENYYEFATGAHIWIKSADRPHTLKVGRISAVAVNEAQQISDEGILSALGGVIDDGGIGWLALNPPNSVKGLWSENLHEAANAVDENGNPVEEFIEEIPFPSDKNEKINQSALSRFARLANIINPDQAKRDALGEWVTVRDRAYPMYSRSQHLRKEPKAWEDVTGIVNNLTHKFEPGKLRMFGAGMDYQRRPYCAFIEAKAYKAPVNAWVKQGTIVYVVRAEVTNDVPAGQWWTEEQLMMELDDYLDQRKRKHSDYLLIGDATGKNQGASGRQRGHESDPATWSWAICERFGWEPHGPIEKSKWVSGGRGQSSTLETGAINPPVIVRMDLVNNLFRQNRVIITPDAAKTAEAFRICQVNPNTRKPKGKGAHLTDAVSYLLYVWETALIEAGIVTQEEN